MRGKAECDDPRGEQEEEDERFKNDEPAEDVYESTGGEEGDGSERCPARSLGADGEVDEQEIAGEDGEEEQPRGGERGSGEGEYSEFDDRQDGKRNGIRSN